MNLKTIESPESISNEIWFDEFIGNLRAHEVMIQTGTAPKNMEDFYKTMITGSDNQIQAISREISSRHFLTLIITEFLSEIQSVKDKILNIAINLSNTKVSVWAVTNDDDEESAKKIILAEAKVNAKYYKYGFYIDSMIMEKSDNYPVPNHYQKLV